jgi:hypothetical protein
VLVTLLVKIFAGSASQAFILKPVVIVPFISGDVILREEDPSFHTKKKF